MAFDFPLAPTIGQTYAPVGGPVFTWDGTAWKGTSQGAPVTVYVSDTAPLTPAIGQLWWNSSTATMAIWYADSDSAQWVQVSGQVLPTAPSDNGEYVMVNGVWRLKHQSFSITGVTTLDITIPAWGPKEARFSYIVATSTSGALCLRMSTDGTTFASGAADYWAGGVLHSTGGAGAFVNIAWAGSSLLQMTGSANPTAASVGQLDLQLTRTAAVNFAGRMHTQNFDDTNKASIYDYYIGGVLAGTASLKAVRFFMNPAVAALTGNISVDWLQ